MKQEQGYDALNSYKCKLNLYVGVFHTEYSYNVTITLIFM